MEKITYLVANYNNAHYVRECIASLSAQTNPNWYCYICDDCSTDTSVEEINRAIDDCGCRSKIIFTRNVHNVGYITTLRNLIDTARTDIVGILDADDFLCCEATEEILLGYYQNIDAEFIYSQYQAVDLQSNAVPTRSPLSARVPFGKTTLLYGYVSAIRTFRRTAYYRTEGLDKTMLYAEDRDLIYKLEEVTVPYFINKVLYNYRLVPGSQSKDDAKYKIGLKNHVLARENAVRRRKMKMHDRIIHNIINDHILIRSNAQYSVLKFRISSYFVRALVKMIKLTDQSSGHIKRKQVQSTTG
jgi:glycosyltransferase involved in cell wall biosynthesis